MRYKRLGRTPFMLFAIPSLILFIIIANVLMTYFDQSRIEMVSNYTVIYLQQQQKISGSGSDMKTEFRYLVITDKETLICENSFFNGKFNNSDIFWRLKKGNTYTFRLAGFGKSFWFDYRNIIDVIK